MLGVSLCPELRPTIVAPSGETDSDDDHHFPSGGSDGDDCDAYDYL